ncbi:unnamed protein product, partial [Meganyctiphanes norvegica]
MPVCLNISAIYMVGFEHFTLEFDKPHQPRAAMLRVCHFPATDTRDNSQPEHSIKAVSVCKPSSQPSLQSSQPTPATPSPQSTPSRSPSATFSPQSPFSSHPSSSSQPATSSLPDSPLRLRYKPLKTKNWSSIPLYGKTCTVRLSTIDSGQCPIDTIFCMSTLENITYFVSWSSILLYGKTCTVRLSTIDSAIIHHEKKLNNAETKNAQDCDVEGADIPQPGPSISADNINEMRTVLGLSGRQTIKCVKMLRPNLGRNSVSWVRNSDKHILTVDRYTFISDNRFTARFEPETETWTLQVKFISASDAGFYECQVSTEPKISHFVNLNVIIPRVSVPGGSELYVRSGSTVTVKCVISNALHPPNYVFWYHESSRVVGGGTLPGVRQEPLETLDNGVSVSSLTINTASAAHAGNYTCSPAHLTPASVVLHVLNGEHPAAMQHGTSGGSPHSMGHVGVAGWMAPLLLLGLLYHRSSIVWAIAASVTAVLLNCATIQRW